MSGDSHRNPLDLLLKPGKDKASSAQNLTRSDVTNQGRMLMTHFIHERLAADGVRNPPDEDKLTPTGTPTGPPLPHLREVADALRKIGDELDGDAQLQRLIDKIPPDAPRQTFMNVAREIFADGNYNWGRVTALFYFAYKMILKAINTALDSIPFLRGIVDCVTDVLYDYVSPWIIERGGWEAVQEHFGATWRQYVGVMSLGVALVASFYLYKYLNNKS